jgi:DNA polymerase-3 subunit delta
MLPTPVILLAGDDDLLLQRELERVLERLRAAEPELDVETYDVAETAHLPELRTQSLFGGRLCAVLRGVESLAGDLKGEVEEYLAAPGADAVLVLVARGTGRIPKVAKLAKQSGERTDVRAPADWDDRGWDRLVTEEFTRLGRRADAAAVAAVRAHAGAEPGAIASKVGQVVAATAPDRPVGAADVEAVVEGHGRRSGFAVADAIAARDAAAALVALRGALDAGEAPLAVLGAVVFRFRQLLVARGGGSAQDAGASPAQHKRHQGIAARFHPGELAWCHDRLAQADVDLKGSELGPDLVLELAVLDVATPREVGAPWNPLARSR